MSKSKATQTPKVPDTAALAIGPADIMAYFYPIHYQISTTMEDIFSAGVLTRKQVVVLQFVFMESARGVSVPRKTIEQAMRRWFEMSTSAISKTLRALARPPLELVSITEDANSGRERVIELTPRGRKFLERTATRATDYFGTVIKDIDPQLLNHAKNYFEQLTEAYFATPKPEPSDVLDDIATRIGSE